MDTPRTDQRTKKPIHPTGVTVYGNPVWLETSSPDVEIRYFNNYMEMSSESIGGVSVVSAMIEAKRRITELEHRDEGRVAEIDTLRQELREAEQKASTSEWEINTLRQRLDQAERRVVFLDEWKIRQKNTVAEALNERADAIVEVEDLKAEVADRCKQVEDLQQKVDELTVANRDLSGRINDMHAEHTLRAEEFRGILCRKNEEINRLAGLLEEAESKLKAEVARLNSESISHYDFNGNPVTHKARCERLRVINSDLAMLRDDLKSKIKNLSSEVESNARSLREQAETIAERTSRALLAEAKLRAALNDARNLRESMGERRTVHGFGV